MFTASGSVPLLLPSTFTGVGPVLHAQVNGRGVDLLLDSSARSSTIDPGVASRAGATIDASGDAHFAKITIGALDLGKAALRTARIAPTGNKRVDPSGRYNLLIVGVLGSDFFASGVIAIDFPRQTVMAYPPGTFDADASSASAIPIGLDDGVPSVTASVENQTGRFIVDTAQDYFLASQRYIAALPQSTVLWRVRANRFGVGIEGERRAVQDVSFGRVLFKNAQVTMPDKPDFDTNRYDGIFGRDILMLCRVVFDEQNNTMYVSLSNQ